MDMILWATVLSVLVQGCLCSTGETNRGCLKWSRDETNDKNVCCDICHPGNYLMKHCGPTPQELCAPCKPKTYTVEPKDRRCEPCTQCVGAQVLVKECTATSDTQCGCQKELTCGNAQCSFCVKECGKGEEPTENRSCRKCPNGTFNDQIHQKCKPWSSMCPSPNEKIVALGDTFHDIRCVAIGSVINTEKTESNHMEKEWTMVLSILPCFALIILTILIVVIFKTQQKRKTMKIIPKPPTIRTPTDDPATLIAIECSFHEAEQEQGSSTESLASDESSKQLIQ